MAIRSGSGGLKYPLPNQAQLVAQQSAAAASAGGSAAASTFGANRAFAANKMRVQADLANSAADRQYRAMAQLEGQNFEAQQNFYDRENRKGAQLEAQRFDAERQDKLFGQQTQMQQAGQQFNREMQWQDQYYQTERDRQGFERDQTVRQQQIDEQDAQIEEDINAGMLELTPAAQRRLLELEAADAEAAIDPTMSDEQYKDFQRQQQEQIRRIRRTAGKPKGPRGAAAFNQDTVLVDEATGTAYDNADEAPPGAKLVPHNAQDRKPLVDNSAQQQDQQKQTEDLYKDAQKLYEEENESGKVYPTFDAALEAARKNRAAAGLPVPGQQQPGGQPAPAPELPPPDPGKGFFGNDPPRAADGTKIPTPPGQQPQVYNSAPGQQPPPVPLPGKPVGPTPTPQPLPSSPTDPAQGPVPLGDSARQRSGSDIPGAAGITPDAFTKGWGSLPAGGVMYGPDGKLYTKK
jgi:hypothetical protein